MRYELDNHLHYYGDHYKYPHEFHGKKSESLLRIYIKHLFILYKIFQNRKSKAIGELILSNTYFTVNEELKNHDYNVYCPCWRMSYDRNFLSSYDLFRRSEK